MIEEINDASSSLNQNTKSNDPVSFHLAVDCIPALLTFHHSFLKLSESLTAI